MTTGMDFQKDCARRLDEGEAAATVMASLRERYSTIRCLNSKSSLIRSMCRLNEDFVTRADGDESLLSGAKRPPPDFPPRWKENVRNFKLSRREMIECKRLSNASALAKNKKMNRVRGRDILCACREEVDGVLDGTRRPSPTFVLAIMLLTGRRTCEIVNGRSRFETDGPYALTFWGQAKRRGSAKEYRVPCLHPSDRLVEAIRKLQEWTGRKECDNDVASRKYQSWLRRTLLAHPILKTVRKVHGLRGLYAKMAYDLFEWDEDHSEAFVVMHILGHAGLNESLVYTPFHLGNDFTEEPKLGSQILCDVALRSPDVTCMDASDSP